MKGQRLFLAKNLVAERGSYPDESSPLGRFCKRIAERYRSEGQGQSARIQGERERDLQQIQSKAYRTAQEIRGKADGEATQIYASAYNRDASFYAFMKSLETYERTADPNSVFILTTDSSLLRFLKRSP